jgi:hypothetical protein
MDVMAFDDEEEHTIVFGEMATTPSTLTPSAPNVTPLEMDILPHSDDEQMIVFETVMVTPVCLFPAIPSTATYVSDSVFDSDCGLRNDNDPRLQLVDEASDDDHSKDALIDVAISLDTFHDALMFLSCAYPIPLATLQGHYNTVDLLPPANGPPTQPPSASSCNQCPFGLHANNWHFPSHLLEIAIADDDPVPAPTAVGDTLDPSPPDTDADSVILANVIKPKWTWTQPCGSVLPPPDIWTNISWLSILLAADSKTRNLCLDPLDDDVTSLVLCSCHDASLHGEGKANVSIIDLNDLVDCTFLLPQQEDGQWFQAHIVKALNDYDSDLGTQPDHIRFLCLAKDGDFEEILSYSELMDSLESQEDGEGNIWKFHQITGHQDSLLSYDKDYNGSLCNVMIEWENGEITLEPLSLIAEVDPIMCASFPCVQEAIAAMFIAMHHLLSFQGNMAQPYDED